MEKTTINGKLALRPGEALLVAGLARDIAAGERTARNKMHHGTFPFPLTIIAGKKLVRVADLLLAMGEPAAPESIPSTSGKLGRKTNEAKALAAGHGVA